MADESLALPFPGGRLKLVDNGDGTYSLSVTPSGGGVPAGAATEAKQDAIIALLTTAVGLLEDIKANTTPTPP
ncbi:hypothetical protein N5K27_22470 [Pigmentiphaga sp. GD03639]|uniref:hypothetical protein n=1 Tax=Pigmentiphaga sp. GD03639 TaxID=2975354 RepID=UPI0024472E40|nr:hypothetical protein [Pigmentiphaga sp. GD03639]MDH2239077.1 hypothetical protein [Pigmentiphaga sp. GD03639]